MREGVTERHACSPVGQQDIIGGPNEGDPLVRTTLGKTPNGIERRFCGPYDAPTPSSTSSRAMEGFPPSGQRLPCGIVEASDSRGGKAIFHRRLHGGVYAVCGGSSRSHSGFDEECCCASAALIHVLGGCFGWRLTGSISRDRHPAAGGGSARCRTR